MAGATFVFSQFANVNYQFMVLFKALDELDDLAPATEAFRDQLRSLDGLLRYQFAFEEDLMQASCFPAQEAHHADHRLLRRVLASLLQVNPAMDAQMEPYQNRFRDALRGHCRDRDNEMIAHLGSLAGETTVVLRNRSRSCELPAPV